MIHRTPDEIMNEMDQHKREFDVTVTHDSTLSQAIKLLHWNSFQTELRPLMRELKEARIRVAEQAANNDLRAYMQIKPRKTSAA